MAETETQYTWHKVFDSLQEAKTTVPLRKLHKFVLDGRAVCFAHTNTGFFAVDDTCPHLGYSLSRGTTNYLNEVICPWHSYRYDLSSGRECEYRTRNAVAHPVEIRTNGIYIGISSPTATR
ncbi:Rieske (2Fe-2S) protein [Pontibacter sp. MBLB2868]|uniref:Rieske (2Fe-2S) protein n=1 Tax=Pontibacter sp. MBLB2868 TaxID=3451555 RepID=UPI003F750442